MSLADGSGDFINGSLTELEVILEDSLLISKQPIVPKRIFIVPYRNRAQHKFFFCKYMFIFTKNLLNFSYFILVSKYLLS